MTESDYQADDEGGAEQAQRCGYVAIVGRPNVGKSTLLNHLMGQKLSITSRKPQTTRHNFLGIQTRGRHQIIYVDTPGLHSGQEKAINRYMNRAAGSAIRDVDIIVFVVDRDKWTEADEAVAARVENAGLPLIIALNKVDRMGDKNAILPAIEQLSQRFPEADMVPLSALHATNLEQLELAIGKHLPEGPHLFPEDQITDRSERFLAAELVREKITRQLGAEVPYEITVDVEGFARKGAVIHIDALILVERDGQKKILIGEKGERLKKIGQQARLDMEKLFGARVMLRLWVKVRKGWSDDERALRNLGYRDSQ